MLSSFPFSRSEEFNSRPRLVSSLDRQDESEIEVQSLSGRWQRGDMFFLMTDALAAWCLRGVELGDRGLHSVELDRNAIAVRNLRQRVASCKRR